MKQKIKIVLAPLLLVILVVGCRPTTEMKQEPSRLKVVAIYDTVGHNYPLKINRAIDTTFVYPRVSLDTLRDADGNIVTDVFNNPVVRLDTTWTPGLKTGRYIELDTILLDGELATQVCIEIESNANWIAPLPIYETSRINWFLTTTTVGGGDAIIRANARRGLTTGRRTNNLAHQYIFTRDSLVLYRLIFNQEKR